MAQHHDIEDVLSSIRRLVANDSGGGTIGNTATVAQPEAVSTDDDPSPALVLDPAQRVIDPDDPFQMIRALAQEERDGRDAEFVLAAVEEEIASITTDIVAEAMTSEDPWSAGDELAADYREDADYQDTGPDAEILGDDAMLVAEAVAETVQPDAAHGEDLGDLASDENREPAFMVEVQENEPIAASTEDDLSVAEWSADRDAPQAEQMQAVDAEPMDESVQPVNQAVTIDTTLSADDAEDDAAPQTDDVDLSDLSEAVGTDDALRELISEIVRQELSGALGERITRNVRKLVRREIRQMLSSGEFD